MITPVHFKTFLKRHRALRRWERNLKAQAEIPTADLFYKEISYQRWIISAFAWDKSAEVHEKGSDEGFKYWRQLHLLWHQEITKIQRKAKAKTKK